MESNRWKIVNKAYAFTYAEKLDLHTYRSSKEMLLAAEKYSIEEMERRSREDVYQLCNW